jgi:hypothetical protein
MIGRNVILITYEDRDFANNDTKRYIRLNLLTVNLKNILVLRVNIVFLVIFFYFLSLNFFGSIVYYQFFEN